MRICDRGSFTVAWSAHALLVWRRMIPMTTSAASTCRRPGFTGRCSSCRSNSNSPTRRAMKSTGSSKSSSSCMGCQKAIAEQIIGRGGNYLFTVKDNQEHLAEDIRACFEKAFDTNFENVKSDEYSTTEKAHGREEWRSYVILHDPVDIRNLDAWPKLCVIGLCVSERTVNGKTSTEERYFIGSKRAGAKYYAQALRNHWRVENCLYC